MVHQILWSAQTDTGLEHCYLRHSATEIMADGLVIGVEEGVAFRIRYQVCCDLGWQVRKVVVTSLNEAEQTSHLVADGLGNWITAAGQPVAELTGCLDVDIAVTPFTNTLPIRRLNLSAGESAVINVVYVAVPALQVRVAPQRYTFLHVHLLEEVHMYRSNGYLLVLLVSIGGATSQPTYNLYNYRREDARWLTRLHRRSMAQSNIALKAPDLL